MAPFRSSGRRDRPGRTQVDHDVFEGLPIRQWKQVDASVGPPPVIQRYTGKSGPWPELPMPRDWHMLPEVSQQLLRAARAGKLYKPPTPPHDEEEKEAEEEAEKAVNDSQKGFTIRKWTQIPRHMEPPEREYLAKRRKGLPSAHSGPGAAQGAPAQAVAAAPAPPPVMRKTKVRKTDAEGNVSVYEVLVPEGQTVEDEMMEDAAEAIPAPVPAIAPGTVIDGVGVANEDGVVVAPTEITQSTPPRRKPPPPRRKPKKGPGRGHKKVVVVEPGTEGHDQMEGVESNGLAAPSIKGDGATPAEGDTPMPDAQEGEEEDSGEEGEEGDEEEGSEEGEVSQTPHADEHDAASATLPVAPPPAFTEVPDQANPVEPPVIETAPEAAVPEEPVSRDAVPEYALTNDAIPQTSTHEISDVASLPQPTEEVSTVPDAQLNSGEPPYSPPPAVPAAVPDPEPEAQAPLGVELPEPPLPPPRSPLAPPLQEQDSPSREVRTGTPPQARQETPPETIPDVSALVTTPPIAEAATEAAGDAQSVEERAEMSGALQSDPEDPVPAEPERTAAAPTVEREPSPRPVE